MPRDANVNLPDCRRIQSSPPRELYAQTAGDSAAVQVTSERRALFRPTPISQACPDPADTKVCVATSRHQGIVLDLQRKFSNQLGFIPTPATLWYIESGNVGIAHENGEACGFLLGRPAFRYQPLLRPITQAAIAMDAQRRHHGLALLAALEARALKAGQLALQCCCAEDLDANEFWAIAGFVPIDLLIPNNARGRAICVWRKQLTHTAPSWFFTPPPRTGHQAKRNRSAP